MIQQILMASDTIRAVNSDYQQQFSATAEIGRPATVSTVQLLDKQQQRVIYGYIFDLSALHYLLTPCITAVELLLSL